VSFYHLRNLAIRRAQILCRNSHDPEVMKAVDEHLDGHDPTVGPYARMSKEQIAERLNQAFDDDDPFAWLNLEEFFLDKLTAEENAIYNLGIELSTRIAKGLDVGGAAAMSKIIPRAFDMVIELREELKPSESTT
jgi:hypothetical protein